jgi:hypothetical protein
MRQLSTILSSRIFRKSSEHSHRQAVSFGRSTITGWIQLNLEILFIDGRVIYFKSLNQIALAQGNGDFRYSEHCIASDVFVDTGWACSKPEIYRTLGYLRGANSTYMCEHSTLK